MLNGKKVYQMTLGVNCLFLSSNQEKLLLHVRGPQLSGAGKLGIPGGHVYPNVFQELQDTKPSDEIVDPYQSALIAAFNERIVGPNSEPIIKLNPGQFQISKLPYMYRSTVETQNGEQAYGHGTTLKYVFNKQEEKIINEHIYNLRNADYRRRCEVASGGKTAGLICEPIANLGLLQDQIHYKEESLAIESLSPKGISITGATLEPLTYSILKQVKSNIQYLGIREVKPEEMANIPHNVSPEFYANYCIENANANPDDLPPLFLTGVDMSFLTSVFVKDTEKKLREVSGDPKLKFSFAVCYYRVQFPGSEVKALLPATTFCIIETKGKKIAGSKFSNFGNGAFKTIQRRPHVEKLLESGLMPEENLSAAQKLLGKNNFAADIVTHSFQDLIGAGFNHIVTIYPDLAPSQNHFDESLTTKTLRKIGCEHVKINKDSKILGKRAGRAGGEYIVWCLSKDQISNSDAGLPNVVADKTAWELVTLVHREIEYILQKPHQEKNPTSGTKFLGSLSRLVEQTDYTNLWTKLLTEQQKSSCHTL